MQLLILEKHTLKKIEMTNIKSTDKREICPNIRGSPNSLGYVHQTVITSCDVYFNEGGGIYNQQRHGCNTFRLFT